MGKCLIKIDARSLNVSTEDPASFTSFESVIRMEFVLQDPLP
jgi:hypothetical protein